MTTRELIEKLPESVVLKIEAMRKDYKNTAISKDETRREIAGYVTKKQDEQPESTVFSTPRKDIYCDWFCSIEEARSYVHEALHENLYAYSAMI